MEGSGEVEADDVGELRCAEVVISKLNVGIVDGPDVIYVSKMAVLIDDWSRAGVVERPNERTGERVSEIVGARETIVVETPVQSRGVQCDPLAKAQE